MALDFPTSPTDGQIYDNYYWDNTNSVWRLLSDSLEVAANFSNTATGTYTDGFDYKYVSFTSSGTLTVTRGGYADILLVGGGGSGGGTNGSGGGGAGGYLYIENAYLPAGSLDVIVGSGGSAPSSAVQQKGNVGGDGEPSRLSNYISPGGGGGGSDALADMEGHNGRDGGSGGGAGSRLAASGAVGIAFSTLGNNGGLGESDNATRRSGGGGGGASQVGQDAIAKYGGDGGNGTANSITGSSVTYAGGGGGGSLYTPPGGSGAGGAGGGGAGGNNAVAGVAGTANTGGGGGGAGNLTLAGDGGSGIVIVRVRTN